MISPVWFHDREGSPCVLLNKNDWIRTINVWGGFVENVGFDSKPTFSLFHFMLKTFEHEVKKWRSDEWW